MSVLTRQSESPFRALDWEPTVAQYLEEQHLAAWSGVPRRRVQFAATLTHFLSGMRDTEVCPLYGRHITDLESFCYQLERILPGIPLERRVDGPSGVTALLRSRHTYRARPASKFRYFIWHDADVLLRNDRPLFGRLLDALMGVSAEAEYTSDELLILHRGIFLGTQHLGEYRHDMDGQFQSWYGDKRGNAFWRIVTGLDAPPIELFEIDRLVTV